MRNHMKQLGLALHNYHDTFQVFPPAGLGYGWTNAPAATLVPPCPNCVKDTSWVNTNGLVLLLPYLEQQPLYDKFDFKQCASVYTGNGGNGALVGDPVTTSRNAEVVSQRLDAFDCPSDQYDFRLPEVADYGIKTGGGYYGVKTNYDFSTASYYFWNEYRHYSKPLVPYFKRMFGENSDTRIADIKDGTSNTAAICERTKWVYNGSCTARGYHGWVMVGVNLSNGVNKWLRVPAPAPPTPAFQPGRSQSWENGGSLHPGGLHILYGGTGFQPLCFRDNRHGNPPGDCYDRQ